MSNPEDEYFARIDRENKEKLKQALGKDSIKAELEGWTVNESAVAAPAAAGAVGFTLALSSS